jgi:hypothetical protein
MEEDQEIPRTLA